MVGFLAGVHVTNEIFKDMGAMLEESVDKFYLFSKQ